MKHFTLTELTRSATAQRLGINNAGDAVVRKRLAALVENVLDPLRERWGAPIIVTSGYRCPALNKAVGGASGSQHTLGEAADIRTVSDRPGDNRRLLDCLLRSGIVFDQVINEYPNAKGEPDWVHVSFTTRRANRGSRLVASRVNGKTVYNKF